MESVQIPAGDDTELTISRVGFGCASLMRLPSGRARRELIAAVLDAGVTHFDVARMYGLGAAERELAKSLTGRRDAVTIATKFGIGLSPLAERLAPVQRPARALLARSRGTRSAVRARREVVVEPRRYDAKVARESLDRSLRELGVDHVDILFLHDPRPQDDVDVDALLDFLRAARDEGKLRAWGSSLDSAAGLPGLGRFADPGVLQMREDLLAPSSPHRTSIAFGVLQWLEPTMRFLESDSTARRRWSDVLGQDLLVADDLAALLLRATLGRGDVGAILYSTTQPQRLAALGRLQDLEPDDDQLLRLTDCLSHDRAAIAMLASA